jgi:hypothetical protein
MKPCIARGIMSEMGISAPADSAGGCALSERVLAHLKLSGSHAALQDVINAEQARKRGETAFGEYLASLQHVV